MKLRHAYNVLHYFEVDGSNLLENFKSGPHIEKAKYVLLSCDSAELLYWHGGNSQVLLNSTHVDCQFVEKIIQKVCAIVVIIDGVVCWQCKDQNSNNKFFFTRKLDHLQSLRLVSYQN